MYQHRWSTIDRPFHPWTQVSDPHNQSAWFDRGHAHLHKLQQCDIFILYFEFIDFFGYWLQTFDFLTLEHRASCCSDHHGACSWIYSFIRYLLRGYAIFTFAAFICILTFDLWGFLALISSLSFSAFIHLDGDGPRYLFRLQWISQPDDDIVHYLAQVSRAFDTVSYSEHVCVLFVDGYDRYHLASLWQSVDVFVLNSFQYLYDSLSTFSFPNHITNFTSFWANCQFFCNLRVCFSLSVRCTSSFTIASLKEFLPLGWASSFNHYPDAWLFFNWLISLLCLFMMVCIYFRYFILRTSSWLSRSIDWLISIAYLFFW